jgi:hypothetical protein
MRAGVTSARECDEAASRARSNLLATVDQLKMNLEPQNLVDEMARASGLRDLSAANALEFAVQRHPIPMLLIALGAGFWVSSTIRSRPVLTSDRRGTVRSTVESLANSAGSVFRERFEARRKSLLAKANSHVAATAGQLSDVVEQKVDNLVGRLPESGSLRPLIQSAVQIALVAGIEALLSSRPAREPA